MPVTASGLFDFQDEKCSSFSIDRNVIASAAFNDLRHSLRSIIVGLSESEEPDSMEVSDRLRLVLSKWLTVPVQFDNAVLLALKEMGEPAAVGARWGHDIGSHFKDACLTAEELLVLENPVRVKLRKVIQTLREENRSFRIFCHRRWREYFESIFADTGGAALPENVFIHSVAEYREAELFDVLLKVGPLRSRGWGSAPDALLTAPRFVTLVQVVWSGCSDEPGFGYDPVSVPLYEGDTTHGPGAVTKWINPSLQLGWKVQEIRSNDGSNGRRDDLPDIDEFEVFTNLAQTAKLQRAALVQVDESHGIFYPPNSQVLSFDGESKEIGYRLPGETLLDGMYLILPVVDDSQLCGLKAEDGHFSTIWKKSLNAECQCNQAALETRLRDSGLKLLYLRDRIEHWCKPPSTVIQAPQSVHHFKILINVLGLKFDHTEPAPGPRGDWWQFAWDEVRRARGEAIQTGFQEQQNIDKQMLEMLRSLGEEICANLHQQTFQLPIPKNPSLAGVFRFYRVRAVEEGFRVPPGELKMLCELSKADQWRA